MRVVVFVHSLLSDWNHGNAHFLRGVATELVSRGHDVQIFEPRDAWSLQSLLADHGEQPLKGFYNAYPALTSERYDLARLDLDQALDGADLVIVHECTPLAVLNISRESMARYGFSPATRVFEAAGAGACLITDAWEGIGMFLEPEREVLVAADGDEVAARLRGLTQQDARRIGRAAQRRILAEHTYAHRAAQVESILGLERPTGAGARIPAGLEAQL